MAKYIILNGQRNYITLTRHLLLKIFIRHLERDRAKNEPLSLQMPDDSFFYLLSFISATLKAPSTSSTPATIIMLLCTEPASDNIAPPATAAII